MLRSVKPLSRLPKGHKLPSPMSTAPPDLLLLLNHHLNRRPDLKVRHLSTHNLKMADQVRLYIGIAANV